MTQQWEAYISTGSAKLPILRAGRQSQKIFRTHKCIPKVWPTATYFGIVTNVGKEHFCTVSITTLSTQHHVNLGELNWTERPHPKGLGSSAPFKFLDPNYAQTLWARATNLSWYHAGSNIFLGALKGGTGWVECRQRISMPASFLSNGIFFSFIRSESFHHTVAR